MSDLEELHKKVDRLDAKQDQLLDKINETNIILAKNTVSLEIHEKRTTASEFRITALEDENTTRKAARDAWVKFGAFLVGFATIIGVVFEILARHR